MLLPRVPVTPIIFTSGDNFVNKDSSISIGIPFFLACAIYEESSATPCPFKIKSLFSKSSNLCSPKTYFIFLYFLSFFIDGASSFAVFMSVTVTSVPHSAKKAISPKRLPSNPRPTTVTFFPLKYCL